MRVLCHVHKWPPIHNAGAETMLHTMMRSLVEAGHEVTVNLVDSPAPPYWLDGILVLELEPRSLVDACAEVDVVVTHLDRTEEAATAARNAGRPIVHVVHNERQVAFHHVTPGDGTLVVFNSRWIADAVPWHGDAIVCRPPVRVADFDLDRDPGDNAIVTLVNLTLEKGAQVFYDLANELPARPFLGVVGAYGTQALRRVPDNVELLGHTPAIRDFVYDRTRIVLMPSSYESWGRVAIEAAASGIPTIAHPTPGLREALGDAGLFADRTERRAWCELIEKLDDPGFYAERSAMARARARELEVITADDEVGFEAALRSLAETHPRLYDPPMAILSSARSSAVCPLCKAPGCACGPSDVAQALTGVPVGESFPLIPAHTGPVRTYRTHRGDFRFDEYDAAEQGLIPHSSGKLAEPVARRLADLDITNEDLLAILGAYEGASTAGQAAFLAEVALLIPVELKKRLPDLLNGLLAAQGPDPAQDATGDPEDGESPPQGRMGDVLAWVGTDSERAERALDVEQAPGGKRRPKLIAELRKILEAGR